MDWHCGFACRIIIGGIIGSFGLSILFLLLTWAFWPTMFGDGQYGMSFMLILPVGWILGGLIAAIAALVRGSVEGPENPYLVATVLLLGGAFVIPIPGTTLILMTLSAGDMIWTWLKH